MKGSGCVSMGQWAASSIISRVMLLRISRSVYASSRGTQVSCPPQIERTGIPVSLSA
ncbi:MAG: hypothetical protein JXB33_07320 [Clostridia bacterium]|nr:hypothetical protein [Clostridia bacterium]